MRDRSPAQAKVKTSPPPIGEARRAFIEELTAWAQEGAPGVDATRVLDLWLLQCAAHGYAWQNWHGMAQWKLREAYYARQDQIEGQTRLGGDRPSREPAAAAAPLALESWRQPPPPPVPDEELQAIKAQLKPGLRSLT